jgi:type I restriction enzyme S subunit
MKAEGGAERKSAGQHQGAAMKKGWETKTIGDVCDVMNGGTPKTGVPEYWDGNHRWITPAEMGKRLSPYVSDTERKITDLGLRDSSARMLPPNSVILSSRAPIGHLVINTEPMGTNQGCKGLIPRSQIEHKFLYYYLSSIVDLLNSLGTGATFKELSGGKLKEVEIPVPPLAEQQRIVSLLDEAFEGLATAKANAEKNLQNARALFESHLQSVFIRRGSAWVEKDLGEVCDFENGDRGTNYPNKSARTASGIPFINAGHLTEFGLDMETMDFISKERFDLLGAGKVQPKDILFCLRGSLGKYASVGELAAGAIASSLVIVRPRPLILDRFVLAYFGSQICAKMIDLFKNGAAQPNLSANSLKKFVVPVPPITEQKQIVKQLEAIGAETQRLARLYERKLAALEALKKSLLHQAFTGEL